MGKPGPAKTPTRILELRDSWRAKDRPDKDGVPTIKVEMPYRVAQKRYAKAYWKKNYQFLADLGLMSGSAHIGFEETAMAYHFMRLAEAKMKGALMFLPAFSQVYRQHRTDYVKLIKQFGCTPSAQASIKLDIKQGKDTTDKDRFFDKKFGNDRA